MPKLSDSMTEGVIVRWLVDDGQRVERGDEIVEIETDKATMVFEAESIGRVSIATAEGDRVEVGGPIAYLLGDGEEPTQAPAAGSGAAAQAPSPASEPAPEPVAAEPAKAAPAASTNGSTWVRASPPARRAAALLGVDLATVTGTGPGGRVIRADIEAAADAQSEAARADSAAAPAATSAPQPAPVAADRAGDARGAVTVQDLTRTQEVVARRMAEAKAAPEFTAQMVIDTDAVTALRAQLRAHVDAGVPSINDLVVKAVALALREHPRVNGAYRDGRFELYERVNIGIAVDTADALVVPTVHDADTLSLGTIASRSRELSEAARGGRLTPAQLSGGTFTVSNLGMLGVRQFTAVLNPPQAAILAVGAIEQGPMVRDGAIVVGGRMALTLTCDHRILYGADAARFLGSVRDLLHQPFRLLL